MLIFMYRGSPRAHATAKHHFPLIHTIRDEGRVKNKGCRWGQTARNLLSASEAPQRLRPLLGTQVPHKQRLLRPMGGHYTPPVWPLKITVHPSSWVLSRGAIV